MGSARAGSNPADRVLQTLAKGGGGVGGEAFAKRFSRSLGTRVCKMSDCAASRGQVCFRCARERARMSLGKPEQMSSSLAWRSREAQVGTLGQRRRSSQRHGRTAQGCSGHLSHGVVVSTQDPESCDRGSNPRGRIIVALFVEWACKKRARPGSNQGPFGLRPNALPLSYVPLASKHHSCLDSNQGCQIQGLEC